MNWVSVGDFVDDESDDPEGDEEDDEREERHEHDDEADATGRHPAAAHPHSRVNFLGIWI